MKVKTSDLTGDALDWAVGTAEGLKLRVSEACAPGNKVFEEYRGLISWYNPSRSWSRAGEILEREKIGVMFLTGWANGADCFGPFWRAFQGLAGDPDGCMDGPDPLIAICRCYVAIKLGDEVEVPDELVQQEV